MPVEVPTHEPLRTPEPDSRLPADDQPRARVDGRRRQPRVATLPLVVAGAASLGAGVVHVAAAGSHGEHLAAAVAFAALAAAQIGWGALAVRHPRPWVAASGAALGTAAFAGWWRATTSGISSIEGLDVAVSRQGPDTFAAALAVISALAAAGAVAGLAASWSPRRGGGRVLAITVAAVVAATTLPAVVAAGRHDHDHGSEDVELAVVPPRPYDPALPIDLGGVDGVTPQEQARAENLVSATVLRLPQFADFRVAEAAGYKTIGDEVTGYEHFVKWDAIDDEHILNPDVPESLVYRVQGTTKTLVAAMYMLRDGDTLDSVPVLGGRLTQWHIHDNLCYTPDPVQPLVRGLTDAEGRCRPPLVKGREIPMIHVWIVPHECGPFAALEGVGAGQIKQDEERWCDHVHGA